MQAAGIEPDFTSVDTVGLARVLLPTLSKFKLNVVAKALNISQEHHHRAVDDARVTAEIYVKFIQMLEERGIETLDQMNHLARTTRKQSVRCRLTMSLFWQRMILDA